MSNLPKTQVRCLEALTQPNADARIYRGSSSVWVFIDGKQTAMFLAIPTWLAIKRSGFVERVESPLEYHIFRISDEGRAALIEATV